MLNREGDKLNQVDDQIECFLSIDGWFETYFSNFLNVESIRWVNR